MAGDVGVLRLVALDATPETTYGTAAATPDKSWPFEGDPPSIAVETINNANAHTGVYEEGTQAVIVGKRVDWAPSYEANMDNLAFHLRAIMGTIGTTGVGPYVHTITVTQADSPSFTLYGRGPKTTGGKLERFTGCKVAQLALSLTAGGKVTLKPTWIGSGVHTEETATAPALNTDSILSAAQVSAFTVNAVNYLTQLRDFEMMLDRKLDANAEKVAGTVTLPSLNSQGFAQVTGKFTLNDEENDLAGIAALAEAKTLVPIVLTLTLGTASAVITIYKAELDSPGETGGKGKVNRSVSFKANYSISDTKAIQAVVTNGTVAYT